jgi:hypothetical protein
MSCGDSATRIETRGERMVREVRVSNKINNFSTEWDRIPTRRYLRSSLQPITVQRKPDIAQE